MSRPDDLKSLIEKKQRRLQVLKEQQALAGISVDPKIVLEIEDIEAEIEQLRLQLAETETGKVAATASASQAPSGGPGSQLPKPREGARIYRDFNLRFSSYEPDEGTFKVWVEGETPGGAMKPDDAAQCTFDPQIFWRDPATGRGGLVGKLDQRKIDREQLFTLGQQLAGLALPEGAVRTLFQQSLVALKDQEGLRLRLCLDSVELAQLPWEFMALPQTAGEPKGTDFLVLRPEISIVRTDTVEAPARTLPDRDRVQVIAVFSSPYDQDPLDIDREKAVLEQAIRLLNQAAGQDLIAVKWSGRPANREAVQQALREGADIFHYAGHAIYEQASQEGEIILEGEGEDDEYASDFYSGEQLAQLLRDAGVRLAVLGACETGRRDGQYIWSGVAPALTREKIPAVIANQFEILDKNAIWMTAKVYHRLLAGYTIDQALSEARQVIYQQNDLENRDWGVPVLYLHDQTGVLFPFPQAKTDEAKTTAAAASPFIRVATTFNTVKGEVIDVQIGKMTGGHLEIESKVDLVDEDGSFTGLKIDKLG
ncbi:MAG: CHAT domain-containing protein [Chloroflexota bacterium]